MKLAEHLLKVADNLLVGSVTLTMGRRAVSTAYYAVFHSLARLCAEELLGTAEPSDSPQYVRVYRALDHGSLKAAFKASPLSEITTIKAIGSRAVELQSERIRADYMPRTPKMYSLQQCLDIVQSAHTTVNAINKLAQSERRILAVHLLFKNRPS